VNQVEGQSWVIDRWNSLDEEWTLLMHPAWTVSQIDWIKLDSQGWVSSRTSPLNPGPCHVGRPQDKAAKGKWFVVETEYPDPVPNPGNYYPFSTAIVQNITSFVLYLHLFTTLNSVVALMYFRLRIHIRSITRTAFVSETTIVISCDVPTPQAVVFIPYFCYLLRSNRIWKRVRIPG